MAQSWAFPGSSRLPSAGGTGRPGPRGHRCGRGWPVRMARLRGLGAQESGLAGEVACALAVPGPPSREFICRANAPSWGPASLPSGLESGHPTRVGPGLKTGPLMDLSGPVPFPCGGWQPRDTPQQGASAADPGWPVTGPRGLGAHAGPCAAPVQPRSPMDSWMARALSLAASRTVKEGGGSLTCAHPTPLS